MSEPHTPTTHGEDNRAPVYREANRFIFRASSIGRCPLRLALNYLGRVEPVADAVRQAWRDGHEIEALVKHRLRDLGLVIDQEQRVLEMHLGGATIRGHWDGRIQDTPHSRVDYTHPLLQRLVDYGWTGHEAILEVKSMSEDAYDHFLRHGISDHRLYQRQLRFYSDASQIRGIVYVVQSKGNVAHWTARYYPEPPCTTEDLYSDVLRTLAAIYQLQAGKSLTCDKHADEPYGCPHDDVHTPAAGKTEVKVDTPDLVELAAAYHKAQAELKALEAEQEARKRMLMAELMDSGADKLRIGGRYSLQLASRKTTDSAAFFRDHPEFAPMLAEYERDSKPWLRFDGPRKATG